MEKLLFTNSGDLIIAGFHAVRMKLNLLQFYLHCVVKMHFYRTMSFKRVKQNIPCFLCFKRLIKH